MRLIVSDYMPPPSETQEYLTLLTSREAADYLRISLSTLRRIEKRGLLVPLRTPGGRCRYTLQMLNACLSPHAASPPILEAGS